ncbi:MAG: PGF-pre-PGF domain-containing protein [Methanomethylovorans sp.]|jgi:PGF-pre-PGF domain-containing protein|nr:PGF-pre-PGF domain-containing protein [Methanomethylovorans sp.]
MINKNNYSSYITLGMVCFIVLILFSIPALAANEVIVSRTISKDTINPGDTFRVTVSLTTKQELSTLELQERIPKGWLVREINSGKFRYHPDDIKWTWKENTSIMADTSASITYMVTVPESAAGGIYTITGTIFGTSTTDGSNVIVNVLGDDEITVEIEDVAPVLAPIGDKAVNENSLLSFRISATDANGDEITYSAVGLPAGATLDPNTGVFNWVPSYTASGKYTIVFIATANGLSDSQTITVTVGDVDRGPVLADIDNKTVSIYSPLSFTISAIDPDGDPIVYSATGIPRGATFSTTTGAFSWTPGSGSEGTYFITFTAESKGLIDSKTVTITVSVDKSSLISAIASATTKVSTAIPGTGYGQYPQPAIDAFNLAIAAAQSVVDDANASQAQVDKALADLTIAHETFNSTLVTIASVTNLNASDVGTNWIRWTWVNPNSRNFNYVMIFLNDVYVINTSDNYYNFTGLSEGTVYNISIKTVDTSGNINPAWVNDSAMTLTSPDITPPATVTNLNEIGAGPSWINWAWENPIDEDFSHVMVYLDGVFVTNTTNSSINYYNATGLSEGVTYTISIKTVDIYGNINTIPVNDTAMALQLPRILSISGSNITETSITLAWEASNDTAKVQITRDGMFLGDVSATSFVDSNLSSDTIYSYILVPSNDNGLEGYPVSINLKTRSSIDSAERNGGGSSGGNSKSSGGGGGGSSSEEFSNIALKDVANAYLLANSNVTYEFTRTGNVIQSISFYSLKNSGHITSTVEMLNNRSKLVNSTPEGSIYKYVNIWVGNAGFATDSTIKDARIKFKVNNSWLEELGVSPADIRLQRYNGNSWEILPTTLVSNNSNYMIFESRTPGFSPFAISANKEPANIDTDTKLNIVSEDIENNPPKEIVNIEETQPRRSNLWIFIVGILIIAGIIGGYNWLMNR